MMTQTNSLLQSALVLPTHRGDRKTWSNLSGSGLSLSIAEAVSKWQGLVLLVTADSQQATRLEEEIRFFSQNNSPILHLPDWE
ncbi:MAG: hypothetical protein KDI39_20625, partial [Pseudomonadales bacterium]|nr:hypothetical protein [Pseudomonadales bacterium]